MQPAATAHSPDFPASGTASTPYSAIWMWSGAPRSLRLPAMAGTVSRTFYGDDLVSPPTGTVKIVIAGGSACRGQGTRSLPFSGTAAGCRLGVAEY